MILSYRQLPVSAKKPCSGLMSKSSLFSRKNWSYSKETMKYLSCVIHCNNKSILLISRDRRKQQKYKHLLMTRYWMTIISSSNKTLNRKLAAQVILIICSPLSSKNREWLHCSNWETPSTQCCTSRNSSWYRKSNRTSKIYLNQGCKDWIKLIKILTWSS